MGFYSIVNQFHQQGQLEVVLVDEILSYVPAFDIFQVRQFNIHSLSPISPYLFYILPRWVIDHFIWLPPNYETISNFRGPEIRMHE